MALLAHTIAGSVGGNTITTGSIDTTGATLLVVGVSAAAGTLVTPTDNKTNTWTALTNRNTGGSVATRLFYAENPTVGTGHTFTYTNNGTFPAIAVVAFSNMATASVLDAESGTTGSGVTSVQPGSITPASGTDTFVTCIAFGASRTMAIDSTFTIADQINYLAAGGNFGLGMAYKSSSAAENPTWSWTPGLSPAVAMGAFKETGGGGGSTAVPVFVHQLRQQGIA